MYKVQGLFIMIMVGTDGKVSSGPQVPRNSVVDNFIDRFNNTRSKLKSKSDTEGTPSIKNDKIGADLRRHSSKNKVHKLRSVTIIVPTTNYYSQFSPEELIDERVDSLYQPSTWADWLNLYRAGKTNVSTTPNGAPTTGILLSPYPPNERKRLEEVNKLNFRSLWCAQQDWCKAELEPLLGQFSLTAATISCISYTKQEIYYGDYDTDRATLEPLKEIPRELALDAHTILMSSYLCVLEADADFRFRLNPFVRGPPFIGFYVGVPIKCETGANIGCLAVYDTCIRVTEPKELIASLQRLALEFGKRLFQVYNHSMRTSPIESEKAFSTPTQCEDVEETVKQTRANSCHVRFRQTPGFVCKCTIVEPRGGPRFYGINEQILNSECSAYSATYEYACNYISKSLGAKLAAMVKVELSNHAPPSITTISASKCSPKVIDIETSVVDMTLRAPLTPVTFECMGPLRFNCAVGLQHLATPGICYCLFVGSAHPLAKVCLQFIASVAKSLEVLLLNEAATE